MSAKSFGYTIETCPPGMPPDPTGTTCTCPEGMVFNPSKMNCEIVTKPNYVLYIALAIAALFLLKGK
jgi:hypothetical protein